MLFHSTNGKIRGVTLSEAIESGLAEDGGLYMPEKMPSLPGAFFKNISEMSLKEIGYVVCNTLLGDLLSSSVVKTIVDEALDFHIPLKKLGSEDRLYAMELFHGPTLSFKDVGARFMARLLTAVSPQKRHRTIILATSGDSGGALADSFKNCRDTRVIVVYPRGVLSRQQIAMFCNRPDVTAVEVGGSFDACQALVKQALLDKKLNSSVPLTSGNSINIARQFPSIIYFFHAYARAMEQQPEASKIKISIPCGNLGNLSAALMAKQMGLPVERFVGAHHANDTFVKYLRTGELKQRSELLTLAKGMEVGHPSNLARIIDLYDGDIDHLREDFEGIAFADNDIIQAIREVEQNEGYLLAPQSATAYLALHNRLYANEVGVVMATAHPVKFPKAIMEAIGHTPVPPPQLDGLDMMNLPSVKIPPTISALSRVILL